MHHARGVVGPEHVARVHVDAVVLQGAEADTAGLFEANPSLLHLCLSFDPLSRCIAATRGTWCRDRAARGSGPVSGPELAAARLGPVERARRRAPFPRG